METSSQHFGQEDVVSIRVEVRVLSVKWEFTTKVAATSNNSLIRNTPTISESFYCRHKAAGCVNDSPRCKKFKMTFANVWSVAQTLHKFCERIEKVKFWQSSKTGRNYANIWDGSSSAKNPLIGDFRAPSRIEVSKAPCCFPQCLSKLICFLQKMKKF